MRETESENDNVMLEIKPNRDARGYLNYLDAISRVLSEKLEELENENNALKEENSLLKMEAKDRESEFIDLVNQDESITKRFIDLEQRYVEMLERFEKEQKRGKLLEIENARNMDELKSLRKENKSLLSMNSDREKLGLFEKLKKRFSEKE